MRAAFVFLVLWCCLGASAICRADTHALLIGVSGYPMLPENRRLRGPANDVQLMRAALLRIGIPQTQIQVLADSVPGSTGLPTRAAILDAMDQLGRRARSGDWAVLYFSGHGSQQPQKLRPGVYVEPDGLDEIFLPYDVGHWNGSIGAVQGAIVDDEIGEAIAVMTKKQVRVWAIFDTCHAGDMARGWSSMADGPVTRYVSPAFLGVPGARLTVARDRQRQPSASSQKATASVALSTAMNPPTAPQQGLVAFYASHADEPAAEEPLAVPAGLAAQVAHADQRRYFGLFTYVLAETLQTSLGSSFKGLADRVAERYRSRPYPTPLFEGSIEQTPEFLQRRP